MKKPNFKHDCDECVFLGEIRFRNNFTREVDPDTVQVADLYVCPQGGYPTVIARFSDTDSDYISGIMTHNQELQHIALHEAQLRAFSAGILKITFDKEAADKYNEEMNS